MEEKKSGVGAVLKSLGLARETPSSAGKPADPARSDATMNLPGDIPDAETESPRKEGLFAKFQKYMAAAAFAELGEHAVAQELVEPASGAHSVLLVIEGSGPAAAAFEYALNLAKRTQSQLDILRVIHGDRPGDNLQSRDNESTSEPPDIVNLRDRLREAGVTHNIVVLHGDTNEAVHNYTKEHRGVSALVLDPANGCEPQGKTKHCAHLVRRISRYLAAPIVTVLPRAMAGEASRH